MAKVPKKALHLRNGERALSPAVTWLRHRWAPKLAGGEERAMTGRTGRTLAVWLLAMAMAAAPVQLVRAAVALTTGPAFAVTVSLSPNAAARLANIEDQTTCAFFQEKIAVAAGGIALHCKLIGE
jgi:hypothetical protein